MIGPGSNVRVYLACGAQRHRRSGRSGSERLAAEADLGRSVCLPRSSWRPESY
jgi:hypothetical protein